MNVDDAINYAQLVQAAYGISPDDLTDRSGQVIKPEYDLLNRQYKVIATIYGNDLATNINAAADLKRVSYGFVLQDKFGEVVISIRGTNGILEWIHDGQFLQVPCPYLKGAGNTEDGFTAIYSSLCVDKGSKVGVRQSLSSLKFPRPITSVVLAGHSLGGALVTLLGLDIAANTTFQPAVYSFAAPRCGDQLFADTFNNLVPKSFRIANLLDLVPKLPIEHPMIGLPEYRHVNGLISLNDGGIPQVALTVRCEHILSSYLFLLSRLAGASLVDFKLDQFCEFDVLHLQDLLAANPIEVTVA